MVSWCVCVCVCRRGRVRSLTYSCHTVIRQGPWTKNCRYSKMMIPIGSNRYRSGVCSVECGKHYIEGGRSRQPSNSWSHSGPSHFAHTKKCHKNKNSISKSKEYTNSTTQHNTTIATEKWFSQSISSPYRKACYFSQSRRGGGGHYY